MCRCPDNFIIVVVTLQLKGINETLHIFRKVYYYDCSGVKLRDQDNYCAPHKVRFVCMVIKIWLKVNSDGWLSNSDLLDLVSQWFWVNLKTMWRLLFLLLWCKRPRTRKLFNVSKLAFSSTICFSQSRFQSLALQNH